MTNWHVSLDGEGWLLKEFIGEDWQFRNSHKIDTHDVRGWRPATVPGSVANDLWLHGEIPDPYYERNSLSIEWVADRTWLYKRSFAVDQAFRGKRCQLNFEGVDYEAQFFLNGELLGTHRSMYTPAVFEIGTYLKYDEPNLLVVVIERAPDEQPQIGKTSAVRTHKSRMTYWWDFCPRMIHIGIWDKVALWFTEQVRIQDVYVHPKLTIDLRKAQVSVSTTLDVSEETAIALETSLCAGEQVIEQKRTQHQLLQGQITLEISFEVIEPRLWWPNGYGEQFLYSIRIRILLAENNEVSDVRETTFGIRHIEFVANDSASADARPYTLVVNGQKLFINGWNWVPMDVMYGVERPAKLDRLLHLAQNAHVNLLRVWGGGLIEKEAFYDTCDRSGILIWQEFILSSSGIDNQPSDDPTYIAMLIDEAEQIIPRKRNHPALAIWCGGNELQGSAGQPLAEENLALAALQKVVARLDSDRYWLPTSPSGPRFMFNLDNAKSDLTSLHDVHGPWEFQGLTAQYTLYNEATCLLHSEFGTEGVTNLSTLARTISEAQRWPVTLDNPVWQHLGAWWVKAQDWREALGHAAHIEALVHGTQYLQAEGVRYAIEVHRRAMYHTSGAIPWQFNEPYPMAACTSAIDYYAQPKPLYYAVARAYEGLHLSAEFASQVWKNQTHFQAELWITHAYVSDISDAVLTVQLIGSSGKVYAQQIEAITIPTNASHKIGTFIASLDGVEDVFFLNLELDSGQLHSRNRYLFTRNDNLASILSLMPTTLHVERVANQIRVTNIGAQAALFIWLETTLESDPIYFSDNYFSLLPGEHRSIDSSGASIVRVQAWNTKLSEV